MGRKEREREEEGGKEIKGGQWVSTEPQMANKPFPQECLIPLISAAEKWFRQTS